jgi:Ca2+-binding EF-hand superfamily protein
MKVILFTTVAIALFALPVFADDKSENTIAVQETVLQHYFSNDTEEYNEAAERLFHKLDVNEDEQINTTDLDQLEADTKANALLGDMFGDTAAAGGSIKTWVMSFDKNGDNSVSQQEFTDGMGQYQNQVITVEMSMFR